MFDVLRPQTLKHNSIALKERFGESMLPGITMCVASKLLPLVTRRYSDYLFYLAHQVRAHLRFEETGLLYGEKKKTYLWQ